MVDPYDDEELIQNQDFIIRKISEQYIVPNGSGGHKISTMAFSPSSLDKGGGMSVDLLAMIEDAGIDAVEHVTCPVFFASLKFQAAVAREADLMVGYEAEDDNPYHGEVWSKKDNRSFTKSQKKKL